MVFKNEMNILWKSSAPSLNGAKTGSRSDIFHSHFLRIPRRGRYILCLPAGTPSPGFYICKMPPPMFSIPSGTTTFFKLLQQARASAQDSRGFPQTGWHLYHPYLQGNYSVGQRGLCPSEARALAALTARKPGNYWLEDSQRKIPECILFTSSQTLPAASGAPSSQSSTHTLLSG